MTEPSARARARRQVRSAVVVGVVVAGLGTAGFVAEATQVRCPVSEAHPGDAAPPEDVAAWMGRLVRDDGLPPELPVMAALVLSEMGSAHRGDPDSVGYFQMRQSTWDKGEYSGYPDDPGLQVQWFADQATAVRTGPKHGSGARRDPGSYGQWIADVERPNEPFALGLRASDYQSRLADARELLRAGCDDRPDRERP